MGEDCGRPTQLLDAVHKVNQAQRDRFLQKLDTHFGPGGLAGKKIGIWGIAFKPGTDDIREAPSLTVMEYLIKQGATIIAHDPVAHEACQEHGMGDKIAYVDDPYDVLDGADALVICTDWPSFKQPDFDLMRARMAHPVVFDGRNLYHPDAMREDGFSYYSVGREVVNQSSVAAK